jgi:hypothetical protein
VDEPRRVCIRIAGNTDIPALLAIRAKGFRLWLDYLKIDDSRSPWHPYQPDYQAEKDGAYFSATSPVELLGLIAMWEHRGDDWRMKPGESSVYDELHAASKTFDRDGNELPDE